MVNPSFREQRGRSAWSHAALILVALFVGSVSILPAQAADDFTTPVAPATPPSSSQGASSPASSSTARAPANAGNPSLVAPGTSRLGHEYQSVIPAVQYGSPNQIEVIEFFSYGCIPCEKTDTLMQQWSHGLPNFVHVSVSPAGISSSWLLAARIFYALDRMNVEHSLRAELSKAILENGLKYGQIDVLDAWLDAHNINPKAFNKAFDSDVVIAETGMLPTVMGLYQVKGVPAVVIDGRYIVTSQSAGGPEKIPGVVGDVVNRVIQERRSQGY